MILFRTGIGKIWCKGNHANATRS